MQAASKKNIYDNIVYYQDVLMKKEGLNTWLPYWAVVRGKWLLFYEGNKTGGRPTKLIKTIELTNGTNCSLVPRRKRRFPFSLDNGHGTYYFKCETELQRYCWICCILLASNGKAPKPAPKTVPQNLLESNTNPKMAKFEQKLENSNKKLEKLKETKGDKMGSGQRVKYAKRLDSKANRYLSKSSQDLREDSSDEENNERRAMSARSARQHEKTRRTLSSDIQRLRRTSSHSSVEIHAQIHSPAADQSRLKARKLASSSANENQIPVLSIIEIEDDMQGTVHVIDHDDALPNMVLDEPNRSGSLSARRANERKLLNTPNGMTHSHSLNDLGKTNLGMNIDDENIIITSLPLSENNRSRTGLSGMASPRITNRKHATDTKPGHKHHAKQETSPRSPVPKSRYSRYNIPSSDA